MTYRDNRSPVLDEASSMHGEGAPVDDTAWIAACDDSGSPPKDVLEIKVR